IETPATRGQAGVKRFVIPADPTLPASGGPDQRSIIGAAGRKLLKVLVYPVTDPVIGAIGEFFAHRWETAYRPYRVRRFSPEDFAHADAPALGADALQQLGSGRALLFVHGTFSTAHG